ncbi:hypothetical protein GCM10011409_19510 [Lentibacillus populi]|uniref:Uncharacterized protein n=1 Tax=Lentibacillus populi TaxID=1827502 RepID=A0A9W5TX56_9BACI|nr:hypothetical protein GCM10011409_19510 [Lentibacillus populi]
MSFLAYQRVPLIPFRQIRFISIRGSEIKEVIKDLTLESKVGFHFF